MTTWPAGKRERLDNLLGLLGRDVIDRDIAPLRKKGRRV
jgi:hypothetical protein